MICKLAGEDEYSINELKLERVAGRLQAIGDETADHCLQEAEKLFSQECEPTHRLPMPARLTALPEPARSGLRR